MLNPTEVMARALGKELAATYRRAFSGREPGYAEVIAEAARLILERIGSSDALYHSAEHTALVALVRQDILNPRPHTALMGRDSPSLSQRAEFCSSGGLGARQTDTLGWQRFQG